MNQKIAILDLGSNSIRTTITEYDSNGEFQVLARRQEMVRISQGMGQKQLLRPEAINRTLGVLAQFKAEYAKYQPLKIIAVATAAVRQARNQAVFLTQFEELMGFPLRVITGIEEAEYDYYGVISTLAPENGLILDTGGASTEIVLVKNAQMKERISLPFGAVNITENYLQGDPPTAASVFKACASLANTLNNLSWLKSAKNFPIIAIGGSNRTLAKIRKNELNQTELPIHGFHLNREVADDIIYQLLSKNESERQNIKGLAKDRSGIIIGGLIPLRLIMQIIDCEQIIFSQSGVREGILFQEIKNQTQNEIHTFDPEKLTLE
ncbi:Ppx/GppA family phosphatase [Xylocopilactobacillus apicola]|uniref:Exopolyphosphatase n=1 Tax=Xylocopilactobacillus apicola TaxID=2932184 RepID=A0AAU9DY21_9LACO|nr:Ppx/GppA family phosphatase [Xylocopilactobacillus apicola]BDR59043.1 exopolyphosphatase [Xylocopilactobacillus apicola]